MREAIRKTAVWGFSPSGTFEQDDMDNWQECTQTSRGVVARRQMLNYQMGLGHENYSESYEATLPANTDTATATSASSTSAGAT